MLSTGIAVLVVLALIAGPVLYSNAVGSFGDPFGDDGQASATPVPEPTCERSPAEVATTVGEALQPPEVGASGMHTFWQFTVRDLRESMHYRAFRGYYEGPRFAALREADQVASEIVEREGDRATVTALARTDQNTAWYVFQLDRHEDPDGAGSCWRIRSVTPA
ncbi:hypothetical protein [Salinarchaeum sp. Harcht-Bsk1]|uniref:hypothetical protein n=1 Tax=Salinarchaeum sp. Harcht-Bsk1 TaxID=1333523 RepID=UPI001181C2F0|nr:hypothetical protein [Salinarchaeum sp. Harcht-Bsk1]